MSGEPGFADEWNPTAAEVHDWAFASDAMAPCEDWELAVVGQELWPLCLQLAADDRCPKRTFFLRVLYLVVGDAVRSRFRTAARPAIQELITAAASATRGDIQRWRQRSLALIADPGVFDHEAWCGGRLAREDP